MLIFKIFLPNEWQDLAKVGRTKGAPVDISDGYIHFSTATQVRETVTKHFSSHDELVVAAVKTDTFSTDLKWEPSRGGQYFPHLYRGLLMTEVEWHRVIKKENGRHSLPEAINELI